MRFITALCALWLALAGSLASAQTIGTVTFEFDSDQLDSVGQVEVAAIAEQLKSTQSYKPTVVVGHTDAVGSDGYNLDLGLRRARTVAAALEALDVPVSRIGSVSSRGERELLVAVLGPERTNRRVQITLEDMLRACRTWRNVEITQASIGDALQSDLVRYLENAAAVQSQLAANGSNGPAYQMAGAATQDCAVASGYVRDSVRKLEYAKRCLCNTARLRVAQQ